VTAPGLRQTREPITCACSRMGRTSSSDTVMAWGSSAAVPRWLRVGCQRPSRPRISLSASTESPYVCARADIGGIKHRSSPARAEPTFVKFPVAFSGGSMLNGRPVPGIKPRDRPLNSWLPRRSTVKLTAWPASFAHLRLLEFGPRVDVASHRNKRNQVRPSYTELARALRSSPTTPSIEPVSVVREIEPRLVELVLAPSDAVNRLCRLEGLPIGFRGTPRRPSPCFRRLALAKSDLGLLVCAAPWPDPSAAASS